MAERVYFGGYTKGELYFSTPSGQVKTSGFRVFYQHQASQLGVAAPSVPGDIEIESGRERLIKDLAEKARNVGANVVARPLGRRKDSAKMKGLWILLRMNDSAEESFRSYRERHPQEEFLSVDY